MLAFEDVTFGYQAGKPLIRDFTWEIAEGDSWSILGPSGSGKTTLLYLMAGLRMPSSGRVCFRGERLTEPRRDIGLVLQDYGLLPWFTAAENIALGLKMRHVGQAERRRVVDQWLERLDLAHVAGNYPAQLSGGQRQRVALARVLALQTKALLMDEPFSSVDELTRERLQRLLYDLKKELHLTTVLVTHSVEEAALLGSRVMIVTDYAPIERVTVLKSPFNGERPERDDPRFTHFTAEIRKILQLW